ncbi:MULTISPECIES: hypothetical protein [Bosea]|uniref:hypothetical protein n=1 Tax=Bosea TaxID=85413 RepID=UPI00214FD326|nr:MULTISPECIES: hypothetical protein [Bosea]MCR4523311.1 hypothetical protein [Bosea sp. 47.2.35]MDR6828616.1 hypothetical protein [Bosea robiniae]MDR6895275.1 hypothetical protein [Bosea sp. BE109]MDR7138671.1 hypothetical protein [Bosea sp. BE168]MDR7175354.1 hypothetical protein [Bosea sp. BE271]
MRRIAALACLLATATLLPVQAEAARFRGGGRSSGSSTTTSRSVVVVPGVALGANRAQAAAKQPERVPFPPATAHQPREEPVPLRLSSTSETKKPWCQTDMVVGGFCMMN